MERQQRSGLALAVLFLAGLLWVGPQPLRAELPASIAGMRDRLVADPGNDALRGDLARGLFALGRYLPAAKLWHQLLKRQEASLDGRGKAVLARRIAVALYRAGRLDQALTFARLAGRYLPGNAVVARTQRALEQKLTARDGAAPAQVARVEPGATSAAPTAGPALLGQSAAGATSVGLVATGEQPAVRTEFMRLSTDERGHGAIESSYVTYVAPDGRTQVVLYGVTHIGTSDYYRDIQGRLDAYDVVLYEAVTPSPEHHPTAAPSDAEAPADVLAKMMGLKSQTRNLSYERPNFVWADLTMSEIEARGGGGAMEQALAGPAAESAAPGAAEASGIGTGGIEATEGAVTPAVTVDELRAEFARSVVASIDDLGKSLGEDVELVIIDWRNDRVMEVLQEQLAQAPGATLAVFYGAAHMPDLEGRLLSRGFKRIGQGWDTAWTF